MPIAFFAWQLGEGHGHLAQMRTLAEGLAAAGYKMVAAFRNLGSGAQIFRDLRPQLFQAPAKTYGPLFFTRGTTFAHLLGNIGFGDPYELFGVASAWRNLFRVVRPNVIIFDHSPIALLAARGFPLRRIIIGSGFCCPPDAETLPLLCDAADSASLAKAIDDEQHMLNRANEILRAWKQPTLQRLAQLYGQVDEVLLTTFPELDHYRNRQGARYWGPVNAAGGKSPDWPAGEGKRIYAYLKPFPTLTDLLESLNERKLPTLIYPDGIKRKVQEKYQSETLRFVNERLNMAEVGQQCDLAILNAGHGTTCDILLAGKPILQIPLQTEQQLMAENVERLGAGQTISARLKDRPRMEHVLNELLNNPVHTQAAQRFAARYASFNPKIQQAQMLQRVLELLEKPVGKSMTQSPAAEALVGEFVGPALPDMSGTVGPATCTSKE